MFSKICVCVWVRAYFDFLYWYILHLISLKYKSYKLFFQLADFVNYTVYKKVQNL